MDEIKKAVKGATVHTVMGVKRMAVTICCILTIGGIDTYHVYNMEPMAAGTITAITLIAAMGGVDVWKNRKEQNV